MITTILIVLVAVVVLIVIIAVLALRYLRADDSDTFDDIPDEPRPRRGLEHPSGPLPVGSERQRRQRQQAPGAWAADRPARAADTRLQQPGYRDRDTGPRPAVPERAGSPAGGQRRAAAAARPVRAARADDADAATKSWESLSDVDYWAELAAADKPQKTSAGSGPAPAARRSPDLPNSDPRQPAGAPVAARGDQGQMPALQRRQPARSAGPQPGRGAEPAQAVPPGFEAAGRRGGPRPGTAPRPAATQRPATGARPALPPRPQAPAAQVAPVNGHHGMGGPADDDPLTSPSFPAINAADSRSYRTRRPANSQPGMTGPNGYPSGPDRISRPDGYPVQSLAPQSSGRHASGAHRASQPAAPAPSAPSAPSAAGPASAPAANPYGSYVSAPPANQRPDYPDAAQPSAGNGWLPAPSFGTGSASDGYLPAAGLGPAAPAHNGHRTDGSGPRGYTGIDYGSLRYDDPGYPDADSSELAGYASPAQTTRQYDQNGYGGSEAGYGPDGYGGYPGYGGTGR